AYLGIVSFMVLDTRRPRPAMGALIGGALIGAAVVGPATDSAALITTCAAISMLSQQLTPTAPVILAAVAADGAVLAASSVLAGRPTDDLVTDLVILCALMLLGLYRRQYRLGVRE